MSHLSQLLRNSRLSQLHKSNKALTSTGPRYHPTHQVVATNTSSLARQEWGLKAALPKETPSRYIIVNDLDTMERLTAFESSNTGFQWTRVRFQEMGVAPTYSTGRANPLFFSKTGENSRTVITLSSLLNVDGSNKKQLKKQLEEVGGLREIFKLWMLQNEPEALKNLNFTSRSMANKALKFLDSNTSHSERLSSRVVGSGGLTYSLQGRLKNGAEKPTIQGRFLNLEGNNRLAAIGGFVANAGSNSGAVAKRLEHKHGAALKEATVPFIINQANILDNGRVELKVKAVDTMKPVSGEVRENVQSMQNLRRGTLRRVRSQAETKRVSEEMLKFAEDLRK